MKKTFRAAVLVGVDKPLEIMELEFPQLNEGQILIQNRFSGICRSQLMEVSGHRGADSWLPHLLGHEGYGIVREIGPSVTKVSPGDKVVISWVSGSGIKSENPAYKSTNGKAVNSGPATTFSEYSVVSENKVYLAPKGFPDYFIPLFGCSLLTGAGMVLSNLQAKDMAKPKSVLVLGFGGVGSSAALILKTIERTEIVVIEKSALRREEARNIGFNHIFDNFENYQKSNPGKLFDYCFEAAGTAGSIQEGFSSIKNSGVLVFASHPKKGDLISIDPYELIKGKTLKGTWGGNLAPELAISEIGSRLLNLRIDLKHLVGPMFTLDEVNLGLSHIRSGSPGKPLIDFGDLNW